MATDNASDRIGTTAATTTESWGYSSCGGRGGFDTA
jgi:hypothetical protein